MPARPRTTHFDLRGRLDLDVADLTPGTVLTTRPDKNGGRRYVATLVSVRAHTRKDGQASAVVTWATNCMRCGVPIEASSGLRTGLTRRRCARCGPRRPSRPVV